MKLRNALFAASAIVSISSVAALAQELTIAIVNNGHMINMQKVAEAYTEETGVKLNWVALEEGVLRDQVTSDTATGGGQYDIINIGMQEAPIWGAAGWIEPLKFSDDYDVEDILPAMRAGLSTDGTLVRGTILRRIVDGHVPQGSGRSLPALQSLTTTAGKMSKAAAAAMHDPDNGVYGACLRGKPGWGDNAAFITTVANSFGARWFDADYKPQLDSPEWNAAVTFYVDLLSSYGPPGSEGNSFNEILALYNEDKCGLWIDATIAASFLENENVAYAQSPNAGNPVGANWLWAWAMAIPAGSPNAEASQAFIEWATSKDYVQAVGNHPDFGWGSVPTGQRASTYMIPEFKAAAKFAEAEMMAIDSAAPSPTDLKPYVGVQFVAIPEFPEIGLHSVRKWPLLCPAAKSVEDALAAAQAAADSVMREAGYY